MSKKNRSFLVVSLLPIVLFGSVTAVSQAKERTSPAVEQTLWSDPATWPDGKVPAAGDKVTIEQGKEVVLDVSPPPLAGLHIQGELSFSDKADVELTTEWILVNGELDIGTDAKPHTHKATITLTDNVPGEELYGMGDRGIMVLGGGTLNLHGDRTNSWTKLAKTADTGSRSIQVLDAKGWRIGDQIVLASTDFDPHQAERRMIAGISGNTITLDRKLDYMHYGRITFGVDERGEVGMLTRNILIQASPDAEKDTLWRARDGHGHEQDVCLWRRVQSHGSEHASRPVPNPLAPGRRCERPVHSELIDSRHLQPLRNRAWHQRCACRKQRDL